MLGIQARSSSQGTRYRGTAYVGSKQIRAPWRGTLDEAVADREALLADRPGGSQKPPKPLHVPTRQPVVYFIQAGASGPIKIGVTRGDPLGRLATLQSSHWERLRLLGTLPGNEAIEELIHAELEPFRIRGEWFTPAPEVLAVAAEASG